MWLKNLPWFVVVYDFNLNRSLFSVFAGRHTAGWIYPIFLQQLLSAINIRIIWLLSSHSRTFHSYGDITITSAAKFNLYARQSWSLRSESSLACHTYCDAGHPFMMVISEDPWHSRLLPSVWSGAVTTGLCLRHGSVAAGIRTPNLPPAGPTL